MATWQKGHIAKRVHGRKATWQNGYTFFSSRSVKMRGFSFLSLTKSLFIFQFLNVKMYNYGKENIIVNFIIKKLKKTQFSQKV